MYLLYLQLAVATASAFAGAALGVGMGRGGRGRLTTLVYCAAGVLLAVTLFDILPEAKSELSWPAFLIAAVSGYGLFWLISHYVAHLCPACSTSMLDEVTADRWSRSSILLMVALAIHCAMDGVAIAVSGEGTHGANLPVLIAVSFHKVPEGMALALYLLGAGHTARRALLFAILVESTTLIGGVLGVQRLIAIPASWFGLLFAHVGGGFLFLVGTTFQDFAHGSIAAARRRPLLLGSGIAFSVTAALLWTIHVHGF
ncbi:MAG: zinc/iron permease [Capsulimonas sp.]|jgi:zinc transporter ZupT|nr:zinc/iron permease [Capsulimonas sp.]